MRIDVLPQIEIGNIKRQRVGDILNSKLRQTNYDSFRFVVAYLRVSGLGRILESMNALVERGGMVSGAVGIDQKLTSIEALETLGRISSNSTIFYTTSGYTFHPKLYLISGKEEATAIVGSSNFTCGGLFQNVELSTIFDFSLSSNEDLVLYNKFNTFADELLKQGNPNVQPLNERTLQLLAFSNLIRTEASMHDFGPNISKRVLNKTASASSPINALFPTMRIPVAPPSHTYTNVATPANPPAIPRQRTTAIQPRTFIMQMSSFDTSHRGEAAGTPEILIPLAAQGFFPSLTMSGRKYPDAFFNVVLNTPSGPETRQYRVWYYETRAVGTKINEYRLRLDHRTVELAIGNGDLIVINKLPDGSDPSYEVTVLSPSDPSFNDFLSHCTLVAGAGTKRYGLF
jgi:HKD family nuclease